MPLNILVLIIVQPFLYNNYAFSRIVTVEDEVVRKEDLLQSKDSEIRKLTEKVIPLFAPLLLLNLFFVALIKCCITWYAVMIYYHRYL